MRPRRLLTLALAVGLVWVAPVVDDTAGSPPAAVADALAVSDWTGAPDTTARAAGAVWTTSAPIDAGDTVLVGADWGGDHDVEVQVRASSGGGWGPWFTMDAHDEHAPDDDSTEGVRAAGSTASEPVWVGPSEQLQFRTSRPLDTLAVDTVAMVGGSGLDWTPDAEGAGAGQAQAATARPSIRTRASWGADESMRNGDGPSVKQDVRFAVVHHVGGGNWPEGDIENGCTHADDWIRGIYAYHTQSRNYDDIAYNFVVDPCGQVWEGRGGGVEKAVQGAHAAGFNSGSVGVLALGTFTDGSPDPVTPELVRGIERIIAWKLDLHHVDPHGSTREVAGGGGTSRYADGQLVDVPVISAHQITNSTSCPGDVLMARLYDGAGSSGWPKEDYVDHVHDRGLPKAFGGPSQTWQPGDTPDGNEAREPLDDTRPVWDVDFTGRVDWRLEIRDDDGDVVRATGGSRARTMARTWDLRDGNGEPVRAGTYTAELTATDAAGDEITPVVTELDVSSPIGRVAGGTRIDTAVELSQEAFDVAESAVLASADAYPDALVASPLAGSVAGPVLLTARDELSDEVLTELERLDTKTVHVVGGAVAVSRDVTAALVARGFEVVRYAGSTRFDTAAQVAEVVADREKTGEVLVALGNHSDPTRAFPDALAAGAFGAATGAPVLLVDETRVPAETRSALAALSPSTLRIFGGRVAVSSAQERTIERAAGVDADRFAGDDRFGTAALAAGEVLSRNEVVDGATPPDAVQRDGDEDERTARPILLASGRNWPDALGAGAATAALQGLFVLVDDTELSRSAATSEFLEDNADVVARLLVAGGPVAVASDVVLALEDLELGDRVDAGDPIAWPADPNEPSEDPSEDASEGPTASPTDTATETATAVATLTETGSPTPTGSATATASPTDDPTDDPTGEPTATESPSGGLRA